MPSPGRPADIVELARQYRKTTALLRRAPRDPDERLDSTWSRDLQSEGARVGVWVALDFPHLSNKIEIRTGRDRSTAWLGAARKSSKQLVSFVSLSHDLDPGLAFSLVLEQPSPSSFVQLHRVLSPLLRRHLPQLLFQSVHVLAPIHNPTEHPRYRQGCVDLWMQGELCPSHRPGIFAAAIHEFLDGN
jgi:hypothetical protein